MTVLTILQTLLRCLFFLTNVSRAQITFIYHIFLVSSYLREFLSFSFFVFRDFDTFEEY